MTGKNPSGNRRKSASSKYRRKKKKELRNREIKQEQVIHQEVERIHTEAEFAEKNFGERAAAVVCPLCNLPITEEDEKYNVHLVTIDHKKVKVHRTCPGESE